MHDGVMRERLLVVTDAFELADLGTALTPSLEWDGDRHHRVLDVELRLPDGRRIVTRARLMVREFYPGGFKRVVHLDLPKCEIPPGTEVWSGT
jgi:hypothetical protein